MPSPANTVAIVRVRAGGIEVALAADAVTRLDPDSAAVPDLGVLLGVDEDPPTASDARRVLVLTAGGHTAALRVEGPVRFEQLDAGHVAMYPPALASRRPDLVLGLARLGAVTVSLIDAVAVVRAARHRSEEQA